MTPPNQPPGSGWPKVIEICLKCGGLVGWETWREGCCFGGVVCKREQGTKLVEVRPTTLSKAEVEEAAKTLWDDFPDKEREWSDLPDTTNDDGEACKEDGRTEVREVALSLGLKLPNQDPGGEDG